MKSGKQSYFLLVGGGIALLLTAYLVVRAIWSPEGAVTKQTEFYRVQQGSLTAQVVDRGVIRPARISPISSKISSNQAKIVWLIKEGVKVSRGDLVARFDTKPFLDNLHKAEQLLADATASYQAAQKLLILQQEEEAGKVEEAQRKLEIAEIKSKNVINGSGPLKRKVLLQKLNQAKRALEISNSEFEDLLILLEKGHVSIREKDKAKDQVTTAREQVLVAEAEIENFDKYLWPQMLREAELLVSGARSELERVQRTGELLVQNRLAEVEKTRRKQESKRYALDRAKRDIANCEVFSPTDGIVLFSLLPRGKWQKKNTNW